MIVFPIVIIISIVMWVYYKVSITKSTDQLYQVYQNAKGRVCLGVFLIFFWINQYLYYQTSISLYIAIAFLILGGIQLYSGYKRTIHYAQELKKRKASVS
ncbi:YtpI family protein [Aquibacillus kalidii]|uniref:YtpI family protein n=1 Tax=Aquibacillus kalidii TaxID=2762597 RepID=UPI001644542C|nr:YtpI family protein [Aquibacillus kalidii]